MFYSTLILAIAALCSLANAQNYSTTGPLSVVPDSVPIDLRQAWCRGQTGSCPQICGGQAFPNNCSADTLTYTCTCTDGSKPNISDFDATLPSFICGQWKDDCIKAHPNDLSGQNDCLSVTCGMRNASNVPQGGSGSQSSSAAASSSSPTGGSGSKTSSGSASSATNTGAAVALSVGKSYGTGLLAVGMAALFGLAL